MKQVLYKLNSLRKFVLLVVLVAATGSVCGQIITFDFEDDGAHRSSGYGSYTSSNTYSENGIAINLTYGDVANTGSPISGSYQAILRVAQNTKNSPVLKIGPIPNTDYKVTAISFKTKATATVMPLKVHYSTDNTTWVRLDEFYPSTTTTTKKYEDQAITGTDFYLRFTGSVSSSTSSNRDYHIDNITITRESTVTASVTLNAYGYATFASSYAVDFTDTETAGYSAWKITDISGSAITCSQITSIVEAGTGVLLKGTPGATVNLNLLAEGGETLSDNKLTGITAATAIEANNYYGLKGNEFVKVNAGTVPAGKALLPTGQVSGVKAFKFVFEDTDDIQTADGLQLTADGQEIYDLAGHKIAQRPSSVGTLSKGFYILRSTQSGASHMKNVRKVLVK